MSLQGPVRLLADDLTGALDSAAAFGPGVPVWLDRPDVGGDAPPAPVGVVATATRDVPQAALASALDASVGWLAHAGLAFKKVDSLLRGNTLNEVRWLAAAGRFERVVFAPALPAQGRYMVDEHLWRGEPGAGAAAAQPVGDGLRSALMTGHWPAHCPLLIPDARTDADLDRCAAGALTGSGPRTLWCGSAGLAAAIARQRAASITWAEPPPGAEPAPEVTDSVWVIGASHQPATRRQWARARAAHPHAVIVCHGEQAAWDVACATLAETAVPLALLDLSPLSPLSAVAAAQLLQRQVRQLVHCARPPARLLVLGGDTARALAGATGVRQMLAGRPVRPGWGQAQWQGGRWHGLWMDCRSGAFGDEHDLLAALQGMRQAHALPPSG
ncbi:MAG: hypothetical protein RJA98_2702 [Pseudomonadota bacterium]